MTAQKCMHIDAMDARKKIENVKNDAICHVTRQNQYNPAGGGATIIINHVNNGCKNNFTMQAL